MTLKVGDKLKAIKDEHSVTKGKEYEIVLITLPFLYIRTDLYGSHVFHLDELDKTFKV
jgi:hypothetical protein